MYKQTNKNYFEGTHKRIVCSTKEKKQQRQTNANLMKTNALTSIACSICKQKKNCVLIP